MAKTIGEYIQQEQERRRLSDHEFADLLDASHVTVGRMKKNKYPITLKFLKKLAQRLNVSLDYLVMLAEPEMASSNRMPTDALMLAERITQLPQDQRAMVEAFVRSIQPVNNGNGDGKK